MSGKFRVLAGMVAWSLVATVAIPAGAAPPPRGSIAGTIWDDLNEDGVLDAGEQGLVGIDLVLFDGVGAEAGTTTTAADGSYKFSKLAADAYEVDVVEATLPAGYVLTTQFEPLPVPVGNNVAVTDANVGYAAQGSATGTVTGTIWDDADRLGDIGGLETRLAGVTVELVDSGSASVFAVTDATGVFTFNDMAPGDYTLDVDNTTVPETYTVTTANDPATLTLAAGEVMVVDVGFALPGPDGSLSGTVYDDVDGSLSLSAGDVGLVGVDIDLFDGSGVNFLRSVATDVNGLYTFSDLAAGSYVVDVDDGTLPAGSVHTSATDPAPVTLVDSEQRVGVNFGYDVPVAAEIAGVIFDDLNVDGIQDTEDGPYPGVLVNAVLDDVVVASALSGADGAFVLSGLNPGDYVLDVVAPDGWIATTWNDEATFSTGGAALFGLGPRADLFAVSANWPDMGVPGAVVVDGSVAYVGAEGAIRIVDLSTGAVTLLAGHASKRGCANNSKASRVRFQSIMGIAFDGTSIYTVSDCAGAEIRVTDATTGATADFVSVPGATDLLFSESFLWVTAGSSLHKFDVSGNETIIPIGGVAGGIAGDGLGSIWVASGPGVDLLHVDIATAGVSNLAVISDISTSALLYSGGVLIATSAGDTGLVQVSPVDGTSTAIAGTETLFGAVTGLSATSAGDILVVDSTTGVLTVLGSRPHAVHGSIVADVYLDADGDAVRDIGESGALVDLDAVWLGPDGVVGGDDDEVSTITTDSAGSGVLDPARVGSYELTVVDGTEPVGWLAEFGTVAFNVNDLQATELMLGLTEAAGSQLPQYSVSVDVVPGEVSTFVGSGVSGWVDGVGVGAQLQYPQDGVVVGEFMYVADLSAIRRIELATGLATTFAGTDQAAYVDSASASQVRFSAIVDLASDGTDLFVIDAVPDAWRLRKTSLSDGATSTIRNLVSSDLAIGPDGALWAIYGSRNGLLGKVDKNTGNLTQIASRYSHGALTADSSSVFVVGVESSGSTAEVFEHDNLGFEIGSFPTRYSVIDLESAGDFLYAAEPERILRIAKDTGVHELVAGTGSVGYADGVSTNAWFGAGPRIASDGISSLFVMDSGNFRIRRIVQGQPLLAEQPPSLQAVIPISLGEVTTVAGSGISGLVDGTGEQASFLHPADLVVVDELIYVADTTAIRVVSPSGTVQTFAGSSTVGNVDSIDPTLATFQAITGITTDGTHLYVSESWGSTASVGDIRRVSLETGATSTVRSTGWISDIVFGPDGRLWTIGGSKAGTLIAVHPDTGDFQSIDSRYQHFSIVADDQYVWVVGRDSGSDPDVTVYRYSPDGSFVEIAFSNSPLGGVTNEYLFGGYGHINAWAKGTAEQRLIAGSLSAFGFLDGLGEEALFGSTALEGASDGKSTLYVVDSGNYAIRAITQAPFFAEQSSAFGWDGYGAWNGGINAGVGNYVWSNTDLSVATSGPKLEVTRTYNSRDELEGPFGRGWTFNYDMSWERDSSGNVGVLFPDGRREVHLKQPDGSFEAPDGYSSELVGDGTGGYILTLKGGTVYSLGSDKRLTSIADANGRTVTLDHGTDEYLDSATDDVGRTISFTWSGDRIASAFTEPVAAHGGPLTWRYYYDANDRLIEACDPRNNTQGTGVCTAFDYDAEDRLSSITKPEGNDEVVLGYDANGLVETRTDGENKTWTFARSTEFAVITTDPRGNTTCQEFDQEFRQIAEYDATVLHTDGCNQAANKTTFGYDAEGYRNLIIDGNGNQSGLTYDAEGNLLNETNGELETTYFEYDPNTDDLVAVRDGRSATALDTTYRTSYDYDPANRNLLSETDPLGNVTSWVYTDGTELAVGETAGETMPPGLLESSTSPRGNVTAEVGDFTTLYAYDQFGDLRSVSAPSGLVTEYTYDEIGRRLTTTVTDDLAGTVAVTSVTYDPVGNALTATGPSVSNSLSGQTTQARTTNIYDLNSNLELSTVEDLNANGVLARVTGFLYDLNDREKQVTDPELGVMVRQFDGNGNVTQVTDQNGTVIRTVYDARNLPVEVWLDNYRTDVSDVGDAGVSFQMSKSEYDLAGRLTSTTEYVRRLDNPTQTYERVTETVYDQADRVDTVTLLDFDPVDGSALRPVLLSDNDYDKAGNLTRLTRGDGVANQLVTQMFYDDAGRLFQTVVDPVAVNPGGIDRTTVLSLDANGNPDVLTMSEGGRTETTTTLFDEADRAYEVTVENGATDIVTSVGYDERGNVVSSTDAKQKTSMSAFDEAGRLISMVAPLVPLNGTTPPVAPTGRYAYNVFGDQIMVEDPNGNVTTVDYDRLSRAEVITHPTYVVPGGGTLQPTELFAYDAVGNKTAETSRRDNTTTWTFDSLSQPTAQIDAPVTEADGITLRPAGTISNVYDSSGNLLETTDQRGAQTTFTYDLLNRVRTQTQIVRQDAAPAVDYVTVFDYDDLGNQTRVTTPFGLDTTTDYSPLGEALLVTDDEGNPTSFEYQFGRVIKVIDPLLRYTTFTYDLAGRQTDVQAFDVNDVELSHSASTYDANGNLETTISPRGFEPAANQAHYTTTYAYDALNRLETVSQPVDGATTITTAYGYDKAGNVTVAVDGNLNETVYTYNAWHLRESIIEPETVVAEPPANRTFTTAYDGGGLPVSETMPGGVMVSRTFDELGRLRRVDGAGDGAASRVFDYDVAGFRTNVSYVDPVTDADIVYDFDDRGLLTGVSGPAGSATYLYDDDGRLRQRVDAAGTHVFDWTGANELQTLTDGVSDTTFTYGWDDASQIDTVTTNTGLTRDYAFDSLGRLDTDTLTDSGGGVLASFDYGYDTEFMTSKIVNLPGNAQSGSHDYEYDFAGRLSSWTNPIDGLVAYSWDGAGNRLTVGTDVYTYDERNRMETGPEGTYSYSPRGTMAALDTGTAIITYDFDSLGRLVDYNGEVSYTYDGLDRVAARNGTGFVYEGGSLDPISDGTFTYGRSPSGRLVSQTDGITPMLAGLDAHGDLSFLYSAVGVVSDTAMFDPFGDPAATTGTTSPTLGFQADFTDPVSEHVWMGSRWYDGGWAVFLSRDTVFGELRTPISLNRYTYAYANPISFFDPDGRLPQPMIDGVCAPGACGSITESDPITAQHETTVLSEGCNAAGYCEYGGTPATATDSVGLAQVEASRRKAGSSLTSEERIGIINGFFDEYPGSALYVGFDVSAASELGFGDAIAAFVEWEIESGRLADSEWWRVVNGNMMLDMRDAQSLLSRGVTTSDRPGVQAWINYALVASSDAPPHPRLCSQYQSTICHGTGERLNRLEQQQQAALWEAHNVSLHHGIDSSADLLAEETGNEQDFIQIVVNNVDRSVLANVPSSGPMPQGLLAPFYVAPGPSQFISEGIDIFGPWNLGPRYPQEYPAPSNWDSAMFVDMPCGFLALTGIPACAANIGLDSTRWRR